MLLEVVVASKNPDKVAEVETILDLVGGFVIRRGLDWPDVPEDHDTLEGNALAKARAVAAATGRAALADDTGLEVAALGGAPGVHTSRYAGADATYADNIAKLLAALSGEEDRAARFRTVAALVEPDGTETTGEGTLEGTITYEPRGGGGFGYDPVFETEGLTLAEIPIGVKNRMSHRALALSALAARISAR